MQPKLKNRYFIFIGFNDLGESLCIQFHTYPNTETQNEVVMPFKYAAKDLGLITDRYSLVKIFLATKPELQKCYKYFKQNYPLLVKGLKANTHPASKKLFKKILNAGDNWQEHNSL